MNLRQSDDMQLKHVLSVIFKRKSRILYFLGLTVAVVAALTFWMTPQYEATSQVLVTLGRGGLLFPGMGDQASQVYLDQDNLMNSEVEILKSASIARRVIEGLGGVKAVFPQLAEAESGAKAPAADAQDMQLALAKFQKDLTIQVVKKSNLINVSFKHPDPRLAAEVANRLTAAYLDHRSSIRKARKSYEFFQNQSEVLDAKLKASERELEQLKDKYKIYNFDEQKNTLLRQKADMQAALNQTISSETEAGGRAADLKRKLDAIPQNVPQTKQDDQNQLVISNLQTRLIELELQEKSLSEKYTDGNRNLQAVRDEIKIVRTKLAEQESKLYYRSTSGLNPVYQYLQQDLLRFDGEKRALSAKREVLVKQIAEFEGKLSDLGRIELQHSQLRSQVETDRRNYDLYLQKLEESRVSDAMDNEKISNVNVVEPATPPHKPVSPKVALNLLLSVVFGLFGGLALAFLLEYLSDRLENAEDVEQGLELPVLTSIPLLQRAP